MSYSIEVLEKEKQLITKCISEWEISHYPEAREVRFNKLKDLNNSIKLINSAFSKKEVLFKFEEFWSKNNCDGKDFSKVVDSFLEVI